jgi:G:T/U-mismatch repair DNA glycosylase
VVVSKKKHELLSDIEHHSEWWHAVPDMRVLIIGSFPPHERQRRYPFYYPNKQNRFWPVLAKIAGVNLKANETLEMVEERKRIMEILRVGVHNIGKVIRRKGMSSLDSNIEIIEYHDLLTIIDEHPQLKTIILRGFSSKSGTAPAFRSYLEKNNVQVGWPKKFTVGSEFILKRGQRSIRCVVVNSTSRAAFQVTFEMLEKQFGKILRPRIYK